jgi:hypothetical protein
VTTKDVRQARQVVIAELSVGLTAANAPTPPEAGPGQGHNNDGVVGGAAEKCVDKRPQLCARCGEPSTTVCSRCRSVAYCGRECQVADWKAAHKRSCTGKATGSAKKRGDGNGFRETMFDIGRAAQFFKSNGYTQAKQMETLTELVASHL